MPLNHKNFSRQTTTFAPDLLYLNGRFERGRALVCDEAGRIIAVTHLEGASKSGESAPHDVAGADAAGARSSFIRFHNRAMLPGMVNAHSHAFQRVIRGRTEYRGARSEDSFWTWREMMYAASARLTPEGIYDASRMAFLEMVLGGITSVGEFHYLHRTCAGAEYDDPNLLAKQVVRAALDTGLRIALLRVAYARAGFGLQLDERQLRFIEPDAHIFMRNFDALARDIAKEESPADKEDAGDEDGASAIRPLPRAWVGVAPHSVRAVPLDYIKRLSRFADEREMRVHMHVAEQPAEIDSCVEETGRTPLALLNEAGVLNSRFTGVHAIHVTPEEVSMLRDAGACICACPTTERNLGDGIVPADLFFDAGVPVALGTDSHTQIDMLEDARELEYNLRLRSLRRNVLAPTPDEGARDERRAIGSDKDARIDSDKTRIYALASRLFKCATRNGAQSIGAPCGEFEPGRAADFFTVDLSDPSIAGACAQEDLLPAIVFSLARTAVREVAVGGHLVVEDGGHAAQGEIVSRFATLQGKLREGL